MDNLWQLLFDKLIILSVSDASRLSSLKQKHSLSASQLQCRSVGAPGQASAASGLGFGHLVLLCSANVPPDSHRSHERVCCV